MQCGFRTKERSVSGLIRIDVRPCATWDQGGRANSPLSEGLVVVAVATVDVAIVGAVVEIETACWVVLCTGLVTDSSVPLTWI